MLEYDVAIIGGGGTGLTAALYTARARRKTVVFEKKVTGGQISTTYLVENFPGFPEGVNGFDLAMKFEEQARKFGAELRYEDVTSLERQEDGSFVLRTADDEYRAEAVIIAAGANYNHLGVTGEEEFTGKGVSYCGTCDGAFFRDRDVVVVGGGNAAIDEALFLPRFVTSVNVIHRRDELRADAILQERAFANDKISFTWDTVVEAIGGGEEASWVDLRNLKTGETRREETGGVFIFIGQLPDNHLLKDLVDMDEGGHAIVDLEMQTEVPGLYVAGDVRTRAARQLISAAGDGATAAVAAERYLSHRIGAPLEEPAALSEPGA